MDLIEIKRLAEHLRVIATTQKIRRSIKDFFGKCDQIRRKLRTWSHLPKKPLMENFIFCVVCFLKDPYSHCL